MIKKLNGSIAVIDDNPKLLEHIANILFLENFCVTTYSSSDHVLDAMGDTPVDVFICDINLPGINGLELMEAIHRRDKEAPVILMTASPELDMAISALKKGAYDFIIKPFDTRQLLHSVKKALNYRHLLEVEKKYRLKMELAVIQRTAELEETLLRLKDMSIETISRLTLAAELRDDDTGQHISRIGQYAELISLELGLDNEFIESIRVASAMHDIGKIGVSDTILLKQGRLTPEEFEVMKSHTNIGEKFLQGSSFPMLQMAACIALTHHERWDGSGYPNGLRGNQIPLEGRIVMLADQYDALRSQRAHKPAFSHEKAVHIICKGDGRTMPEHFDNQILDAFKLSAKQFDSTFNNNANI